MEYFRLTTLSTSNQQKNKMKETIKNLRHMARETFEEMMPSYIAHPIQYWQVWTLIAIVSFCSLYLPYCWIVFFFIVLFHLCCLLIWLLLFIVLIIYNS